MPILKSFSLFILLSLPFAAMAQLTTSNLPIIVIDTDNLGIPDEPKITGHLGIIWNGDGAENEINDDYNEYDGAIGVEIRGQTSQFFDKKSYSIETRMDDGSNNNVELFGWPAENDWVLHGPFSDKSLMRNALAYLFAESIMDYAPRVKMVEVVVNGDYKGVYLFTEKIKRDNGRVDVDRLLSTETSDISGGYILRIDKDMNELNSWASDYPGPAGQDIFFQYFYPKPDSINQIQKNYIQDYVNTLEDELWSGRYADSLSYRQYIDMDSFMDFFFINELSKNVDGYRISTYLHKQSEDNGGLIKMGPVWDFNLGFGNVDYCTGPGTEGWLFDFNDICPGDIWTVPFWWKRMYNDDDYFCALSERWAMHREGALSDERVLGTVDSLANLLEMPAARNFDRWPILNQYVWPNATVENSYEGEIARLRGWLKNRLAWMDDKFTDGCEGRYIVQDSFDPFAFPNPSVGNINIRYYAPRTLDVFVKIYDAQGKLVQKYDRLDHVAGTNDLNIQLDASGIYFYTIYYEDLFEGSGKFVVH